MAMRHNTRTIVAVVACLASLVGVMGVAPLPVAGAAGDVSGIDVRLPRRSTGAGVRVSGRITSQPDGAPESSASLWLTTTGAEDWYDYADADADGRYHFAGVPAGSYVLEVRTEGSLQDGYYRAGAPGHFTSDEAGATELDVGTADITGVNIRLPLGADLRGRIVGLDEGSAFGASVAVYRADGLGAKSREFDEAFLTDSGRFRFRGLPPDDYILQVTSGDMSSLQDGCYRSGVNGHFTPDCLHATALSVGLAGRSGIEMTPAHTLTLVGRIEDRDGNPVCGTVTAHQVNPVLGYPDEGSGTGCGRYQIYDLDRGRYVLSVQGADGVNIQAGWYAAGATGHWDRDRSDATVVKVAARTVVDPLRPPTGGTISGSMYAGYGTDRMWAVAVPVRQQDSATWVDSVRTRTGFRITGLTPGRYRVALVATAGWEISGCAWYDRTDPNGTTWDLDRATVVQVPRGNVSGVDAWLPRGSTMRGRVTRPSGQGVDFAEVEVVPAADLRLLVDACHAYQGFEASASENGAWVIRALPAGRYKVSVWAYEETLASGWYRKGAPGGYTPDRSTATWVRVGG
jgi:hypothetical protein